MAILTREYNKQMVLLDTEINNIDLLCNTLSIWSCRRTFGTACRSTIGVSCRKKESKFWTDQTAFSEGRAYKWNTNPPKNLKNKYHISQQQSNNMNSMLRPQNGSNPGQNQKTQPKGRGKFKRSRNNRGSPEQDSKKRTVETIAEGDSSAPICEHTTPSRSKHDTSNIGIDPSSSNILTSMTYTNQSVGRSKSRLQNPLNRVRGSSSPQTNRGVGNLDAYITWIQ